MNIKTTAPDYVTYPLLAAIIGPIVLMIPVIGPILFLPFSGVNIFYEMLTPESFNQGAEHLEYGFAWVEIKTLTGFFYLSFFCFTTAVIFIGLRQIVRIIGLSKPNETALVLLTAGGIITAVLVVFVLDWLSFHIPTQTRFLCGDGVALRVDSNRIIWREDFSGEGNSGSWLGSVDDYYNRNGTSGFVPKCKNSNGQTVLDVYLNQN